MKRLTSILLLLICLITFSSEALAQSASQMASQIESATKSITSLQCDFTQTKTLKMLKDKLTSKGKMLYNGGKQLRWEYTSPYQYVFIINNQTVTMKSSKGTNNIDVKSSRTFQGITRLMMNSLTGKCISDSKEFKATLKVSGKEWLAILTPQQKDFKQMFSTITLHYDPQRKLIVQVDMTERSGDITQITLTNIKKNAIVPSSAFTLR